MRKTKFEERISDVGRGSVRLEDSSGWRGTERAVFGVCGGKEDPVKKWPFQAPSVFMGVEMGNVPT